MLGDHSVADPPDSMPNSEVKRNSADGSVGSPHVRVGHRQALNFVICIASNSIISVLIWRWKNVERWLSGLKHRSWKPAWVNSPPRVQIPISPPHSKSPLRNQWAFSFKCRKVIVRYEWQPSPIHCLLWPMSSQPFQITRWSIND